MLKFNNTSITNTKHFLHITNILKNNTKQKQITTILSTPTKITNHLITIIKKTINNQNTLPNINNTKHIFTKLLTKLTTTQPKFPLTQLKTFINQKFTQIKHVLHNINLLKQYPNNINTTLIYHNKKISITIITNILKTHNHNITIINPIKKLLTIKHYLKSTINITKSTHHITTNHIPTNHIILITNFTTNNKKNKLIILKHNNSNYSTTILTTYLHTNYYKI